MEDGRFVLYQLDSLIREVFPNIRAQGSWLVLIGEYIPREVWWDIVLVSRTSRDRRVGFQSTSKPIYFASNRMTLATRRSTASFDTRCRLIIFVISMAKRPFSYLFFASVLLYPISNKLLVYIACWRVTSHLFWDIDGFGEVANAVSVFIDTFFAVYVLGWAVSCLSEVTQVAIHVELWLNCVQRVRVTQYVV